MPTTYPKCSPTEMMGLLILLKAHGGNEDLARLAEDLDLEIDEILPACDYAQALGLLKVAEGRVTLSDSGKELLAGSIRDRKTLLRELLKRTTLFRALLRALDNAPEKRLTEDEVYRLIEFTTAPADDYVQNIINWGRYTELFRYDADQRILLPARAPRAPTKGPGGRSGPPGAGAPSAPAGGPHRTSAEGSMRDEAASLASVRA